MSHTLTLYRLQQTDTQTDRLQARLKTIQQILEDDGELRLAKESAEKAEASFGSAQRTLHQDENAVRDQRIKIEQIESSLYSGTVRIPKELQDLQNDVASLKRHLATLEDRQLDAMIAFDDAGAAHRAAQADLQTITAHSLQKNQALVEERDSLLKEVEKLNAERLAIKSAVTTDILEQYESLRQQRRGVAVTVVTDNSCSACGSTLAPLQVQNARFSADLSFCPSCGRILYCS
jgi:predicted  nucleic acid-binding Zn-ribbon protein